MGKCPSNGTPGKKPAAQSASKRPASDIKAQVASELYAAFEVLGADAELLSTVGSWRDTLNEALVLSMLR